MGIGDNPTPKHFYFDTTYEELVLKSPLYQYTWLSNIQVASGRAAPKLLESQMRESTFMLNWLHSVSGQQPPIPFNIFERP